MDSSYDVIVVGSGPNGLAAGIVAARAGLKTLVVEAAAEAGGGVRSAELTLPGFLNDVCSAVHPMALASPFFRSLPLAEHGLRWAVPSVAAAHPLDGGRAALLFNEVGRTADGLGPDAGRYRRAMGRLVDSWPQIEDDILAPIGFPKNPGAYAAFGARAILPAEVLARRLFHSQEGRALFAGCCAHSVLPFTALGSASFGWVLMAAGHRHGWPVPLGGSRAIATALTGCLRSFGGELATGFRVDAAQQLPRARAVLFDTSPAAMARVMVERLPAGFRARLERYPYGPGAFKVDWALSEAIPWRAEGCRLAATVHVGGSLKEIAASEAAAWHGEHAARPFVLVTQPSLFDPGRAPAGRHTAWGYCHVPRGSSVDATEQIEAQIERFAPGFRDAILARAIRPPSVLERENPNLVGGDVGGGSNRLDNLFFRPTWRQYATPDPGIFLCSAASPPGGGVHGMCGYHAARLALKRRFGIAV